MLRKILVLLAALALLLLLVKDVDSELLFQVTFVSVIVLGLVLSVFYLSTWGFFALKAWRNGRLHFASITVLEFVIIPILAIPSFGTALWNVIFIGFAVVPEPAVRTSRLIGLSTLLLVMILRTLNWVLRWREKKDAQESVQDAISDSNPL